MAQFELLTHVVLRDQVKAAIRRAVAMGELLPGEWVSERDLSVRLGVSRIPVREALRQLDEQGLVVTYPHRGSHVVELSREDARDLVYARVGLEQTALRIAWEAGGVGRLLARLEATLGRMAALDRADPAFRRLVFDVDSEFHTAIIESADSPHLSRLWGGIDCFMPWIKMGGGFPCDGALVSDHAEVLAAFRPGDLAAAQAAVARHVERRTLVAATMLPSRDELAGCRRAAARGRNSALGVHP